MNNLPAFHYSNDGKWTGLWNFLIYHNNKRDKDYLTFMKAKDTDHIQKGDLNQKFNDENPDILRALAEKWDIILDQAGLRFDVENAKIPFQLAENLEAYIRVKNSDTIIHYNLLSSGMRNFIFRLGHIYALYFNRDIERGFLFLDEPEQSLYPDFLYDIIERYLSVIHNTQLFVATHSEIVAAQFKPSERIRLRFDDEGTVSWHRGISPEGDDPNDVLWQDFGVRNLYGKKGIEKWNRYRELRRQIPSITDPVKKIELMNEYIEIGTAYNFGKDDKLNNEIPS